MLMCFDVCSLVTGLGSRCPGGTEEKEEEEEEGEEG